MKKILLVCAVMLYSSLLMAQNDQPTTNKQLSVNFLVPSLEWEVNLGQKTTLDLDLGTSFAYAKSWGGEGRFGFYPGLTSQYRYYYNFDNRLEKGKKVSENSGNYWAAIAAIRSGKAIIGDLDLMEDFAAFVGPTWGMQRVYNSGFKLNLNLGAGYAFNDLGNGYLSPYISLQLGWLIR